MLPYTIELDPEHGYLFRVDFADGRNPVWGLSYAEADDLAALALSDEPSAAEVEAELRAVPSAATDIAICAVTGDHMVRDQIGRVLFRGPRVECEAVLAAYDALTADEAARLGVPTGRAA